MGKKLYDKTMGTNAKNEAEVIMFDNIVTVYRNSADVWFYVVGSQLENELILVHVLMALLEALNGALRTSPDKRTLLGEGADRALTAQMMRVCKGVARQPQATLGLGRHTRTDSATRRYLPRD